MKSTMIAATRRRIAAKSAFTVTETVRFDFMSSPRVAARRKPRRLRCRPPRFGLTAVRGSIGPPGAYAQLGTSGLGFARTLVVTHDREWVHTEDRQVIRVIACEAARVLPAAPILAAREAVSS